MRQGPYSEQIIACRDCELRLGCRQPVPGEGSLKSGLVLLGRNPGHTEDEKGRPFVGRGGERLFSTLLHLGYPRTLFYVTNLVKCYTLGDEPPGPQAIITCSQWWKSEFEFLKPRHVIALGNQAFSYLRGLPPEKSESVLLHMRKVYDHPLGFKYTAVVHPGAAVRNSKHQKSMEEALEWFLRDYLDIPRIA